MEKIAKHLEYEIIYKSADEILNDINFDYEFEPKKYEPDMSKLAKSMFLETLITKFRPYFSVAIHVGKDKKWKPFHNHKDLLAFLDFIQNKYEIFRFETLPELNGKHYNELPYVMRADLEKPIIRCLVYKNLKMEDFLYLNDQLSKMKL